jgi:Coenzyme PQQ synthesis protein D (PqqD)
MGEIKGTASEKRVTLTTIPRVHDEAAVRQVGGRWVAATADDRLHTFAGPEGVSAVGERIVSLVDGVRSVGEIAGLLVDEFEVSRDVAEADTLEFISQLINKQVLSA